MRRSVCSIALLLVCLDWKSDSFSYRTHFPFDSKVATLPAEAPTCSPEPLVGPAKLLDVAVRK